MSYKVSERFEPIFVNSDLFHIAKLTDVLCGELKWLAAKISVTPLKLKNNANGVRDAHEFTLYLERLSKPGNTLVFTIVIEIIADGIVFEDCKVTLKKTLPDQTPVEFLSLNCKFDEIFLAVQNINRLISDLQGFSNLTQKTTLVFTSGLLEVNNNA